MSEDATQNKENLEDIILKTCDLPVLPATAQKLMSLMADPNANVEKLRKIVMTDPGMTAKILKIANSAFYGGYRTIQNLSQAIMRLGFRAVENIVMAGSMKGVYKRFGLTEKLLWEQSIGSAVIAHLIARRNSPAEAEDAFVAGLLHDVGNVILNNEHPDKFGEVMEKVYNDDVSFAEAEMDVFGFSHRDVGALVVRKWSFPETMEMMLRHFDDVEKLSYNQSLYDVAKIVNVADRICMKYGIGWRTSKADAISDEEIGESLDITQEELLELIENVKAGVDDDD
jgi:HD-like signal output (HDOD) protein